MNNLAVVIVACDKNSHIWNRWYAHFIRHWNIDAPVYFINEVMDIPYLGVKQIKVGHTPVKKWTRMLRRAVKEIHEDHLFIMMDDHIMNFDISDLFTEIYEAFNHFNADAFRIRAESTSADIINLPNYVHGKKIKKLSQRSKYLASFSPNIWRKEYLLRCISRDQSPWRCETSWRIRGRGQLVLDYEIPRWFTNAIEKGKLT